MKTVTGKILEGEQILVIIPYKSNPKLRKYDVLKIGDRRFRITDVENVRGHYNAEVRELFLRKKDEVAEKAKEASRDE